MNILTANEAKTQFGNMLLEAQREPIQINKNGKPVAVVISIEEYQTIESLKLQLLRTRAAQAEIDMATGNVVEGDSFFDELISGKHD